MSKPEEKPAPALNHVFNYGDQHNLTGTRGEIYRRMEQGYMDALEHPRNKPMAIECA